MNEVDLTNEVIKELLKHNINVHKTEEFSVNGHDVRTKAFQVSEELPLDVLVNYLINGLQLTDKVVYVKGVYYTIVYNADESGKFIPNGIKTPTWIYKFRAVIEENK